jgi:hypothetical protein
MTEFSEGCGDMQAALEYLAEHHEPGVLMVDNQPILAAPRGINLSSAKALLDTYREYPERAVGFDRITDPQSFVAHVTRHAGEQSVIFAKDDPQTPTFIAVYDYHQPKTAGREGGPRHGEHGAIYSVALSDEFKAWHGLSKRGFLAPVEFAEFVEERITDVIAKPEESDSLTALRELLGGQWATPAKLIELSRGLQVHVAETVKSAQSLSSGEISLTYDAVHQDGAGQQIRVPSLFAIGIPIFRGGGLYQLAVRLRYRIAGGKLSWAIAPHQMERAWDHAFEGLATHIAEATGAPVYRGHPELRRG